MSGGPVLEVLKIVIGVWAVAIAGSFAALEIYQMRPGRQVGAPVRMPDVRAKEDGSPSLWAFIHPKCPCSSATIAELERIDQQTNGKLKIQVFIVTPKIAGAGWEDSPSIREARANRSWQLSFDRGGAKAASVGALTSGFTVLYDSSGAKVFQGGVTASRGHEGDNIGHDEIVQFMNVGKVTVRQTPVYGCDFGDLNSGGDK